MIKYDIKKISEKNIRMIPRKMVEISEQINQITAKMKGRIEKEIPDTGYFRNFAEDFENKNKNIYARAISMSEKSCDEITEKVADMLEEAKKLGISEDIDPFITLSFMALTVIPEIRVTERGVYLFGAK